MWMPPFLRTNARACALSPLDIARAVLWPYQQIKGVLDRAARASKFFGHLHLAAAAPAVIGIAMLAEQRQHAQRLGRDAGIGDRPGRNNGIAKVIGLRRHEV